MEIPIVHQFQFATETIKQVMTLASAILALTVTFAKENTKPGDLKGSAWLIASWVLEITSILFGILGLMFLTGQTTKEYPDIWIVHITLPVTIQISTFFLAMVSLVVASCKSFGGR
ncbi:MAG: hypothetical protein MI892_08775 [Desulfobacterales bacterium]|nr:hypothetical protein [Desulfobacterales bacterium]